MVKSTKELPPSLSSSWNNARYLGNGLIASDSVGGRGITFLRIPPSASRKPIEGWDIPPFPFQIFDYTVHPPANVLAVAERYGLG